MSRIFRQCSRRSLFNQAISSGNIRALIIISILASFLFTVTSIIEPANADTQAAGLRGEYFDNEDFTNLKITRTDPVVDFNWGFASPDPSIEPDRFSIRWTGTVTPPASGSYIFVTRSDDGARLWINDQMVIDNFTSHPDTEDRSQPINLIAGQSYNLRLEYFELTANAVIRLLWIKPGESAPEVIPQSQLMTPPNPNPAPTLTAINPTILPANSPAFILTVTGTNFIDGSALYWNNSPRPTTLIGSSQLNANIPASDLAKGGLVGITVVNPQPGGGASNMLVFTVSGGYEADVAPRPDGNNNGRVTIADWTQVGRFSAGLDTINFGSEYQRADCAPLNTLGNGQISIEDWVQTGRYASGLDPVSIAGGPGVPTSATSVEPGDDPVDTRKNGSAQSTDQSPIFGLFSFDYFGNRPKSPQRSIGLVPRSERAVAITISSLGDENALGFSLRFDASRWEFVSAVRRYDLTNSVLIINDSGASRGQLGMALALGPGERLRKNSMGVNEIVLLTFRPSSANIMEPRPLRIEFDDRPVRREVVNDRAVRLRAIFNSDHILW